MQLRNLIKGWTVSRVPIVVPQDRYAALITEVEEILGRAGIAVHQAKVPWTVRLPVQVRSYLAGSAVDSLSAENLTMLQGHDFEAIFYSSNLVICGEKKLVIRAHANIIENLSRENAYLTWSKEANATEDRIRDINRLLSRGDLREASRGMDSVSDDLHRNEYSLEEWEILYRELLRAKVGATEVRERQSAKALAAVPSAVSLRTAVRGSMRDMLVSAAITGIFDFARRRLTRAVTHPKAI